MRLFEHSHKVAQVGGLAGAGRAFEDGEAVIARNCRLATSTPGVPGPPMNLCGEMKTASLVASAAGFMSIGRYGAAAA